MALALTGIFKAMAGTFSAARSRQSGISEHQDEAASDGRPDDLKDFLSQLAPSSSLDVFRQFFDIKTDYWNQFRDKLKKEVEDNCSWPDLKDDKSQRRICAKKFLERYGREYWGTPENRRKYLMEERLEQDGTCLYPENKDRLVVPLALRLCCVGSYYGC